VFRARHGRWSEPRLLLRQPSSDGGRGKTSTSTILASDKQVDQDSIGSSLYQDALVKTTISVALAGLWGLGLGFTFGPTSALEFSAGYLVEQSLSVDNLFVFLLLFEYFKVPFSYQNKILNWGIIGAMAMRAVMILAGAAALKDFHAILLVFASILVFSSGKILTEFLEGGDGEKEENLDDNWIVKLSGSLIKSTDEYDGDNFFTVSKLGEIVATPMLLCLVAVEVSDVVFAVDSIPAVFGVTEDPLIVFSSNIFAIAGLRSLYIVLSRAVKDLKYLEPSVALVLGFIGAKMIAEYFGYCLPTTASLGVVAAFLGIGVGASVVFPGTSDSSGDTNRDDDIK